MIYFYLTIRVQCSKLRGADMGDGDVIHGGSEGCEVFLEEMTVEIRARDREQHRSGFFYPVPPLQKMLLFHPDPTRKLKKTTSRLVPRRHQ